MRFGAAIGLTSRSFATDSSSCPLPKRSAIMPSASAADRHMTVNEQSLVCERTPRTRRPVPRPLTPDRLVDVVEGQPEMGRMLQVRREAKGAVFLDSDVLDRNDRAEVGPNPARLRQGCARPAAPTGSWRQPRLLDLNHHQRIK